MPSAQRPLISNLRHLGRMAVARASTSRSGSNSLMVFFVPQEKPRSSSDNDGDITTRSGHIQLLDTYCSHLKTSAICRKRWWCTKIQSEQSMGAGQHFSQWLVSGGGPHLNCRFGGIQELWRVRRGWVTRSYAWFKQQRTRQNVDYVIYIYAL